MNLDTLSLNELKRMHRDVTKAIDSFDQRHKTAALAKVQEIATAHGFKLADLLEAASTRAPVAAKYADPSDPSRTWTGRGRKPKWVQDALDGGKSLEALSI